MLLSPPSIIHLRYVREDVGIDERHHRPNLLLRVVVATLVRPPALLERRKIALVGARDLAHYIRLFPAEDGARVDVRLK